MSKRVSDYRKLIKRVELDSDVILDHVHTYLDGERDIKNIIIMKEPSKEAVYRLLSGFHITGWINNGWFVGEEVNVLICDDRCPEVIINWKFNWTAKEEEFRRKEGVLLFENEHGLVKEKKVKIAIELSKMEGDNWKVSYEYDGENVRDSFIKCGSIRYMISKIFKASLKVFEEFFWKDTLDYYLSG